MRKKLKKYLLILCGVISVVLGVIGIILPILPTTPFLILALGCFANSSPRFHKLLLDNRWFGLTLQQWEDNRTVTRTTKRKAMLIVVLTFSVSLGVLYERPDLQMFLLVLATVLLSYIWRIKENKTAFVLVKNVDEVEKVTKGGL